MEKLNTAIEECTAGWGNKTTAYPYPGLLVSCFHVII